MSCETVISKLLAIASRLYRQGSRLPVSMFEMNGLPIPLWAAKSSCPQPRRSRSLRTRSPRRMQISFLSFIPSAWGLLLKVCVAYALRRITVVMSDTVQSVTLSLTTQHFVGQPAGILVLGCC